MINVLIRILFLTSFVILCLSIYNIFIRRSLEKRLEGYNIFDDIGGAFESVGRAFVSVGEGIADIAVKAWDEVYDGLKSIGYTFEGLANDIKDYTVSGFNSFKDAMTDIGNQLGDPDLWKKVGMNTLVEFQGLAKAYVALQTGNIEGAINEVKETADTMYKIASDWKPPPPDYTGTKITVDMVEITCPVPGLDEGQKKRCTEILKFNSDPDNRQKLALQTLNDKLGGVSIYLKKLLGKILQSKLSNGKKVVDYLSSQDVFAFLANYLLQNITDVKELYSKTTRYDDTEQEKLMKGFALATKDKPDKRKEIIDQMGDKLPQLFGKVSVNYPNSSKVGDDTRDLTLKEAYSLIINTINWEADTAYKNKNLKDNYDMNMKPYIYDVDLLAYTLYRITKGDLRYFYFYLSDNFFAKSIDLLSDLSSEDFKKMEESISNQITSLLNTFISSGVDDFKNKLQSVISYFSKYPSYDQRFSIDKIINQIISKVDPKLRENQPLITFIINNYLKPKAKGEWITDKAILDYINTTQVNPRAIINQLPKNLFIDLMMLRQDRDYSQIKDNIPRVKTYLSNLDSNGISSLSKTIEKEIDKCAGCFPANSDSCSKEFSDQCVKDGCKVPASFDCKSFLKGYTYPPTDNDVPASCSFCYPLNKDSPYSTFCTKECNINYTLSDPCQWCYSNNVNSSDCSKMVGGGGNPGPMRQDNYCGRNCDRNKFSNDVLNACFR